ncbi:MAG: nucleotidyltransferase family protein [Candidatus Omnitrophica bacterium]|nr:nucleotidyltransferase family protein [Candidatus Omnitrophota bacterium]
MKDNEILNWYPSRGEELLLKAALWNEDEAVVAWQTWIQENGVKEIDHQFYPLGAMLYQNLKDRIHEPYMNKFKGVYRSIWFKNQFLLKKISPVLRALENEKIPMLSLKGMGLTLNYYKDFGLRPMWDVDILIPRQEVIRVSQLLGSYGFKRYESLEYSIEELMKWCHSIGFRNPQGLFIDLHWESLWCSYKTSVDDDFWADAKPFLFDGISIKGLSASDQFLHVCVHGARKKGVNPYSWAQSSAVKCMPDAMKILRVSKSLDWERIIRLSREMSVTLQMRDVVRYLATTLKAPIPTEVVEQFQNLQVLRMERVHYRLTMDQAQPQTFWEKFIYMVWASYMTWLRRHYGLKNVNSWGFLKFSTRFIFFCKDILQMSMISFSAFRIKFRYYLGLTFKKR